MHCVILGCGRVGSRLAHALEEKGHSVAIVDQNPAAFRRLGSHFEGKRVEGFGLDRKTLEEAGIQEAHAFAAVSSGDNSNIITARIARERFQVENVVARIYDPRRAEVYQRLGIQTVRTVQWTTDRILRRLLPEDSETVYQDPTGTATIAEFPFHPGWVGRRVRDVEDAAPCRVAFLLRLGEALLPTEHMPIQEDDLIYGTVRTGDQDQVATILAAAPEGSE